MADTIFDIGLGVVYLLHRSYSRRNLAQICISSLGDGGHVKSGDMKISAPRALALSVAVGHALAAVTKGVSDNIYNPRGD
jgi:hypothetical protein